MKTMKMNKRMLGAILLGTSAALAYIPASAGVIYSEDFEGGAPGFSFSSYWHVTANAPYAGSGALGFVHDETAGAVPNGSYAGTDGAEFIAFSPLIALPNSLLTLDFAALVADEIGDEPDSYDRLSIGVSLDGSSFDSVLASSKPQNGGVNIPENVGYNLFSVDLNSYAGSDVYLAFSFATLDGIDDAHPGPRVDNVAISAIPEPGTLVLLGLGGLGLVGARRKTRVS